MQNLCIIGKKVVLTSIIVEDVDCRAAIQCPIYQVPCWLLHHEKLFSFQWLQIITWLYFKTNILMCDLNINLTQITKRSHINLFYYTKEVKHIYQAIVQYTAFLSKGLSSHVNHLHQWDIHDIFLVPYLPLIYKHGSFQNIFRFK